MINNLVHTHKSLFSSPNTKKAILYSSNFDCSDTFNKISILLREYYFYTDINAHTNIPSLISIFKSLRSGDTLYLHCVNSNIHLQSLIPLLSNLSEGTNVFVVLDSHTFDTTSTQSYFEQFKLFKANILVLISSFQSNYISVLSQLLVESLRYQLDVDWEDFFDLLRDKLYSHTFGQQSLHVFISTPLSSLTTTF